ADRIGVMYAGKMVEISSLKEFFRDPLHPYSQALISSVPSLSEKRVIKGLSGVPPNLRYPPPGCRFHTRCPHAIPGVCDEKEPPLLEVKGRFVSCHLYG
ncbi:MAG: ABC transporter ATP-binding protein, partial [Thermoproteota archaeon]